MVFEYGLAKFLADLPRQSSLVCLHNVFLCAFLTSSPFREKKFCLFTDDPQDPLYEECKAIIPLLSYCMTPERQKLFLVNHAKKALAWYKCLKDIGNEAMLQEVWISAQAFTDILTPEDTRKWWKRLSFDVFWERSVSLASIFLGTMIYLIPACAKCTAVVGEIWPWNHSYKWKKPEIVHVHIFVRFDMTLTVLVWRPQWRRSGWAIRLFFLLQRCVGLRAFNLRLTCLTVTGLLLSALVRRDIFRSILHSNSLAGDQESSPEGAHGIRHIVYRRQSQDLLSEFANAILSSSSVDAILCRSQR